MSKDKVELYTHLEDGTNVKKTWSCKALILQKKGAVTYILLVQNEHDEHWSLPGGSMHEWENEETTLNRECREELWVETFGITHFEHIDSTERVFQSPVDKKWRHKVYMWHLCTCNDTTNYGKWKFIPILEAIWMVKDFEKEILGKIYSEQ
jgi:ADP-ribose pyrophosphatase YjhB (NUDIX family)